MKTWTQYTEQGGEMGVFFMNDTHIYKEAQCIV